MKHLQKLSLITPALIALVALGGCASYKTLAIESVEAKKTLIQPQFKESFYRVDRDKNFYFIMRQQAPDRTTGQPVDQVLIIRMFWQPIGGRTTMNSAALNATFRYLVMTPTAVGMYEGAGFVRIYKKAGKVHMSARVVDGDLRLTEATANFNDNLGRSHLSGTFAAKLADAKAFDMLESVRREFFARSFALGSTTSTDHVPGWGTADTSTQPAAEPATAPATEPTNAPATDSATRPTATQP